MQNDNITIGEEADTFPAQRLVSQLDHRGFFVGPVMADASPLEPGVYLIPGNAVEIAPPSPVQPGRLYMPADSGGWDSVEDLRAVALYRTRDGQPYQFGAVHDGQEYDGIGPYPEWLTLSPRPNEWSIWTGTAWEEDAQLFAAATKRQRAETKTSLLIAAGEVITPLQDAEDLGIATEDERARLQRWKLYRIELTRVNPADHEMPWPDTPA